MTKIAFIGAGSYVFTRTLVRDLLTFPELEGATLALMDIDSERLDYAKRCVQRIVKEGGYNAKIVATKNRRRALKDADAVLCTILAGDVSIWRHDIEIPMRYGVDMNVGDTRSVAGIFRALRTIPVMLDICRDMEDVCLDAILLNYTNPMAMLCRAMQRGSTIKVSGLCHSVQGTASKLARWLGAPREEIEYVCGGINHLAWYVKYEWNGEDAIPLLLERVRRSRKIRNEDPVRNEMFLQFGYFPTESSGHFSEYNWWFRKRPDLIEKYCTRGKTWNPGRHAAVLKGYLRKQKSWRKHVKAWINDPEPLDLTRGREYAAPIISAYLGGAPYKFNGNVANKGLIDNLPADACVEVPVFADESGFHPVRVGPLPAAVLPLTAINVAVEELAVEAAFTGDRERLFQAVAYDPLCAAVLSLAEIRKMVDALLKKNKDHLPQFFGRGG
jgi:alpha-galactosidase